MADISDNAADWSATAGSNSPSGSTAVGTGLDDNLRAIQAAVVAALLAKGSDIASASSIDLSDTNGLFHDITGTTTITGLGTVRAGIWKVLKFEGALTLTHNATSLILPGGADITTADGDIGMFESEGSGNWRCIFYSKASGKAIAQTLTLGTEQASTSGTEIDFTSIPSWVKRITIQFVGMSTDGTNQPLIQIGDSGGIEATGYLCGTAVVGSSPSSTTSTTGFALGPSWTAAVVHHGHAILTLEDSANFTWVCSGTLGQSNSGNVNVFAGSKSLSAALDRVRITTSGGTDNFDAGAVNILYE